MSTRKAVHIKELALAVHEGTLDLETVKNMTDLEVGNFLSALRGVGIWTAEMLMTFSLQRPDIISWGDLGIHRGLRMVYRHKKITKDLFLRYKKRYSPYASVASLYLWAIAGGACSDLTDPAVLSRTTKK